jgi:hypothetical protein
MDNDMKDKITHTNADLHYAVQLVDATCCLAGSASYLDDVRADLRDCGIIRAIKDRDTPALFDWLVGTLSFQGISDSVAAGYIAKHGNARWADVADGLARTPSCPKLTGYWRFTDCRYYKDPARARSPATSAAARCRGTRSGTGASTRWRTACSCSCEMSPIMILSAGLIRNWAQ